jgi:hypothetical protein
VQALTVVCSIVKNDFRASDSPETIQSDNLLVQLKPLIAGQPQAFSPLTIKIPETLPNGVTVQELKAVCWIDQAKINP